MLDRYSRILDYIENITSYFIGAMLIIMTFLMGYQVVLRYIFNNANAWTEELLRYLFVWLIMLGGSVAIRENSHMKVEVFLDVFSDKVKIVVQIISYILVFTLLAIVMVKGALLVSNTTNNLSAGLQIPMSIPYLSLPVGGLLMMLTTIEYILYKIIEFKKKKGVESR